MSWLLDWREVAVFDANAAALGVETSQLMAAAGKALAGQAIAMDGSPALILCGSGNNGGDGFACALSLLDAGGEVRIIASHEAQKGDAAQEFRNQCENVELWNSKTEWGEPALVIDCLLGVGSEGEPRGVISEILEWARKNNPERVLACDIPSGLGTEQLLPADATVTFHAEKSGMDYADVGQVVVAPLPWPDATIDCGRGDALRYPPLDPAAHKGSRGRVLIIGGGPYHGAPLLAGSAAARTGCDLVHVIMPREANKRAKWPEHLIPERMYDEDNMGERAVRDVSDVLAKSNFNAIVIGPGLGREEETLEAVSEMLKMFAEHDIPTVIDADALYALPEGGWPTGLRGVATPHARELKMWLWGKAPQDALVSDSDSEIDPESRVIIRTGAVDELHGLEGRYCLATGGNPRMATGGTGDLLAGTIGGLLAQGMNPWPAARLACWLLRAAGDKAGDEFGVGLLASDVPKFIAQVLSEATPN